MNIFEKPEKPENPEECKKSTHEDYGRIKTSLEEIIQTSSSTETFIENSSLSEDDKNEFMNKLRKIVVSGKEKLYSLFQKINTLKAAAVVAAGLSTASLHAQEQGTTIKDPHKEKTERIISKEERDDFKKTQEYYIGLANQRIQEKQDALSDNTLDQESKIILEKELNLLKQQKENFEYFMNPENFYKINDGAQEWYINNIKTDTYRERLSKSFDLPIDHPYINEIIHKQVTMAEEGYQVHFDIDTPSHFNPKDGRVHMGVPTTALSGEKFGSTMLHEKTHKLSHEGISFSDVELLSDSHIDKDKFEEMRQSNFDDLGVFPGDYEYYAKETEINARKKVTDMELEKLGILKYGEPFTENTYEKLKKLVHENKVSQHVKEFFLFLKKDSLIKIMNTLADTSPDISINDETRKV